MNRGLACEILDIENDEKSVDIDIVKKQYRIKALLYHPDKNNSPDACDKFRSVLEAYEFLSNHKSPSQTYKEILADFMNSINEGDKIRPELVHMIVNKISQICGEKAINMINTLDKNTLLDIYKLMNTYKNTLYIPGIILSEMTKILIEKMKKDEIIYLHPSIDDLLSDNVFRLIVNNHPYLIPLWHNELVYDNSGNDLYIKCIPDLPSNIEIHENNDLTITVKYNLSEIFERDFLLVNIGNREFKIEREKLLCKPIQSITYVECGIPLIQNDNIYDVTNRGKITIRIHLISQEKTI